MKIRTKELKTAARKVAGSARHEATRRLVELRDELLVEAGKAAEDRQRMRTRNRLLKKAAAVLAVAGAGTAAVFATRAAVRRNRKGKG
jgi:hypothetical protein